MSAPYIVPGTAPAGSEQYEKSGLPSVSHNHNHNEKSASASRGILDSVYSALHPVSAPVAATFDKFHNWKENMGLIQPGTVENLTRDVNQTLLNNFFFEGARADLSRVVSPNPAFQITHGFQVGAQKSSYSLGALYATNSTFLHGLWDPSTGGVNMRANQTWSATDVTKVQGQLSSAPGQTMLQFEHDHLGPHYSLTLKSINPSPLDFTGIHMVSLLHSFTSRFSFGFDTIIQHTSANEPMIPVTSWLLKYTSLPNAKSEPLGHNPAPIPGVPEVPFVPSWTATAQLQPSGNVQATYFQKLSDKVDVALDLQTMIQPASFMGPAKREALATLGAKYDFRMATFRGQIDSAGKVGMLLEQRFTPTFAFLVGGELDHAKNTSRFGVGIMIESSTMSPEEMQAAGMLPPQ